MSAHPGSHLPAPVLALARLLELAGAGEPLLFTCGDGPLAGDAVRSRLLDPAGELDVAVVSAIAIVCFHLSSIFRNYAIQREH